MVCDHAWGRPMPRRYLDKAPIHAEDRSFFCAICFSKYGLFQIFFCLLKSYVMNVSLSHMLSSGRLDERSPFLYLICKRFKSIFDLQKAQVYISSYYFYLYSLLLYCTFNIVIRYFRNIDNHHEQLFIAPCEKLTWMALLHRWIDSWRSSILKGWEQNLKVSVTFLFNF